MICCAVDNPECAAVIVLGAWYALQSSAISGVASVGRSLYLVRLIFFWFCAPTNVIIV